jgi:hypothetical protein
MITDARSWIEDRTGERMITQEWKWTFNLLWKREGLLLPSNDEDYIPERYADKMIRSGMWIRHQPHVKFPIRPLQDPLVSMTYRLGGTDVAYADMANVRTESDGSIIFDPLALPPLSDEQYGAITITANVGYSVDASLVPGNYLRAIRLLCEHWYENRGLYIMPNGPGRIIPNEMAAGVSDLIGQKRVLGL